VVLTATNAVDYAYEEKGADLSIYTRYLIEGITSGAADEDEDGVITVEELHRFAGRKVEEISPAMSPKIITLRDEGYRIILARSPQDDPKVKYRKEVERRAESGQFSIPARRLLLSRRQELGVLDAEAEAIEFEVLKPFQEYQRKRQEYQETLCLCLQEEETLNPNVIKDLMDFRDHLGLQPEDVAVIDQELLGFSLENYKSEIGQQHTEREQIRHIEKLQQQYRAGFLKAIKAGYPLNEYVINGLKQFQRLLEISDEEVISIERPIREVVEAEYQKNLRVKEESTSNQKEKVEQKRQDETSTEYEQVSEQRKYQEEQKQGKLEKSTDFLDAFFSEKIDDLLSERFGVNYYAKLRDLLAAKEWKAADLETTHCMLAVMDRQEKNYLSSEDFRKFPCQDLHNIDNLWVKYSRGKFGFSIQRAIWESCKKSNYFVSSPIYHEKEWSKFGETVGWKTKRWLDSFSLGSGWYSYKDYNFSETAPKGHLPSGSWGVNYLFFSANGGCSSGGMGNLFDHIDRCKL
jgi:hypothetical protein